MTPFLRFVHTVSENPLARRLSNRMDALATMIQFERGTYEQWLGQPELIQKTARAHFVPVHESRRGQMEFRRCSPLARIA